MTEDRPEFALVWAVVWFLIIAIALGVILL